jgi:tetratricopeptide (TPR) repeat protein
VVAQRGHLQQAKGDLVGAETQFLISHELDPDDATYLIYAGGAAFARGDIQRAEEHARAASKCPEGRIDEAYFNLGGYLLAQKRYSEARTCYIKALEIDPEYAIARSRLKDLYLLSKTGAWHQE